MAILTEKTLLMDIELNTNDIPTISTDIGTIASDTTNILADTTSILADTNTIAGDTTSLDNKMGEVQTSPTSNTVLDRLKTINTSLNQNTRFTSIISLTRPADTTAYAVGDIINGNALTILPVMDLSSFTGSANRYVKLDTFQCTSSAVATFNLIIICTYNK